MNVKQFPVIWWCCWLLMQRSRNHDYNLSNILNEKCVWNRCVCTVFCFCFNYNSLIDCILVGVILVWCCGWAAAATIILILTGSSLFYCFTFNAKKRIALHLVVGLLLHFHHLFLCSGSRYLHETKYMQSSYAISTYWCNLEITCIYLIYLCSTVWLQHFLFFSQFVSEHDECLKKSLVKITFIQILEICFIFICFF